MSDSSGLTLAARLVVVLLACLVAASGVLAWLDSRHAETLHYRSTTISASGHRSVAQGFTNAERPDPTPVVVAALAAALVLVGVAAARGPLRELEGGGVAIRFGPDQQAAVAAEVSARTNDPETASRAYLNAIEELARSKRRISMAERVTKHDIEQAVGRAFDEA
jgi:hypothetical protein